MEEFTRIDAHAVHSAMMNAEAEAKEREEKMPSSASALLRHAADLYTVREKIQQGNCCSGTILYIMHVLSG